MNKILVVLLLLAVAAMAIDFDIDYDAYSVDELRATLLCLSDKGPCSELDARGRQNYPAIVLDACKLCDDKLKHILGVFINRVRKELPELYQDWRNLNDPEGEQFDKFEESVAAY